MSRQNSKAVLRPAFRHSLRRWRRREGLTQRQAAAQIGATLGSFRGWEQGRYEPATFGRNQILKIIGSTEAGQNAGE